MSICQLKHSAYKRKFQFGLKMFSDRLNYSIQKDPDQDVIIVKPISVCNPSCQWTQEARACSDMAIDKANLVIAVVAHRGAAGRKWPRVYQEGLAARAIGGRSPAEKSQSASVVLEAVKFYFDIITFFLNKFLLDDGANCIVLNIYTYLIDTSKNSAILFYGKHFGRDSAIFRCVIRQIGIVKRFGTMRIGTYVQFILRIGIAFDLACDVIPFTWHFL